MDLAELIIAKGDNEDKDCPDGYYVDDMGYWVETDIRKDKARYAEYILFRCLKKHAFYLIWNGALYTEHKEVYPTSQCINQLADIPHAITYAQANWVYNRLRECAPTIDETKIYLGRGLVWDFSRGEVVNYKKNNFFTISGYKHETEKRDDARG